MKPNRRRERGSALLIVLVFAAILAIMLYRELPVAAFEAQRQKEELLMDRGNEYKRAIKLYVRKFQTFPPSIEALENTNRMRFLRNRYVDPFTGKDDWRLLHAGPGGMITDSKIKHQTAIGAPGANDTKGAPGSDNSSTLGAPSSATNVFANSFSGSNLQANGQPAAANNFPQRPPALALNGGNAGNNNIMIPGMPIPGSSQDADQQVDPLPTDASLQNQTLQNQSRQNQAMQNAPMPQTSSIPYPGYPGPPMGDQSQLTSNPMTTGSGAFPVVSPGGRYRFTNPTGNSSVPGQFGTAATASGPPDQQGLMQSLLNTQNTQPTGQTGSMNATANSTGGQMGTLGNAMGAGIAGVASKSTGHTIKVLNDQTDRSLWEFVYDMQKEAMANAPGIGGTGNGVPNKGGMNGSPAGQSNFSNSAFGQNNTFGNSSSSSQQIIQPLQPQN